MSLMYLFPWLDYGINIVNFENFDFLVGQPIFTSVRAGPVGQNVTGICLQMARHSLQGALCLVTLDSNYTSYV